MNWKIVGHEWAVKMLMDQVARGEARHAYLFTGPPGVGRRTLALRLAQALNCLQPPEPGCPCLTCRACQQIERMQHPDLAVIQAEADSLKVEQIRDLQRSLALAPYEARYRVALFLRFEEATASAANALLKSIEEPPPQVILLLTAENTDSLLPTIVSRCEVLRLRALPLDQISQWLQSDLALSPERADLLAHVSGGRPGYARRLHLEPELMEQRLTWLDDHARLLQCNRLERFKYVDGLTKEKNKGDLKGALLAWLSLWRDVFLQTAGAAAPLTNLDRIEEIQSLAERFDLKTSHAAVSKIERTLNLLDRNVNLRLAGEVLMLDLPRNK